MLRILITDDHPIVRRGLRQILDETDLVQKIVEAESGKEALEKIGENNFDVVLLDISMPGMDGIETAEEIKKLKPSLPILIISMYPERDYALRAFKAGALGYLTKKSAPEELATAIKKVINKERYITPTLADLLLADMVTAHSAGPLHESLSNREIQVMRLIVEGKSLKEIAGTMSLSPKTIGTFRTRILQKMNMTTNAELVKYSMHHQLFDVPME